MQSFGTTVGARTLTCASVRLEVVPEGEAGPAAVDLRALLAPRILSQRQIAQIARSAAAQRRELDALVDAEAIRAFEGSSERCTE